MAAPSTAQPHNRRRPPPMPEWRCSSCHRLLIRAELKPGSKVEAYCGHCHKHVLFVVSSSAVW
jgi:phage FluMu protein Com